MRGYHGNPFVASIGVTKSYPVFPIIINTIVGEVVIYWLLVVYDSEVVVHGLL